MRRVRLQRAEEAVSKARAVAEGGSGEIHVGYAPSLTIQILPRALRTFQTKFPRTRVALHDLSTEEMLSGLRTGKLQVTFMARPPRKMLRGLQFRELASYPVCAAFAPGHCLAKSKTVRLEQLTEEPLIAYSRKDYPEYHDILDELFAGIRKPRVAEEHDGITSIIAAVESSRGFALVPKCVQFMAGSRVKVVPLDPPPPPVPVGAAWKKETETVRQFIGAAEEDENHQGKKK